MNNCIVAQSGGPTAAINASLAGVVSGAKENGFDTVYGAYHGIQGFMNDEVVSLDDIDTKLLRNTPSMYLGSCRFMLPDANEDPDTYKVIFSQFVKYDIKAFFYIGGNDSMDTVAKLSKYAAENSIDIKCVGIPKTIDNDLNVTDHTPGYGSAAKFIATTLLEVSHDTAIYPINSVTIVEIMGRDAGWLTGAAALARNEYSAVPHLIYLPEAAINYDEFIEDVKKAIDKYHNVVIAISEGIKDATGHYITAGMASEDRFGHSQLSGAGRTLEYLIKDKIDVKVRSVEINIPQRTAGHLTSYTDIDEAFDEGKYATEVAMSGETGVMITINRISDFPYATTLGTTDVNDVAGLVKHVPREWINERGNDVTDEFVTYAKPLIQGEVDLEFEDGLPKYFNIKHLTNI